MGDRCCTQDGPSPEAFLTAAGHRAPQVLLKSPHAMQPRECNNVLVHRSSKLTACGHKAYTPCNISPAQVLLCRYCADTGRI